MTYGEVYREGKRELQEAGIRDFDVDARILFEQATGMNRGQLFLIEKDELPSAAQESFFELIEKRKKHLPVQLLTGTALFFGYPFFVNGDVLIPRPDTEILVEEALTVLKRLEKKRKDEKKKIEKEQETASLRILDLCTGSGCVLLSLMKELEKESIRVLGTASDLSERALKVAKENAARLELKVDFQKGDLFSPFEKKKFHLITANPPYIRSDQIDGLDPEVRDHDPHLALDGGSDGLYFLQKIAGQAKTHLEEGGYLLMEMGFDQGEAMQKAFSLEGYQDIRIVKDLAGMDRVVIGRLG